MNGSTMTFFDDFIAKHLNAYFEDGVQIVFNGGQSMITSGIVKPEQETADDRYKLIVKTDDIRQARLQQWKQINIVGASFSIVETLPDDGVFTAYILRRYS